MRRFGRRLNIEALRTELPIRGYFFDCLRFEADSLADRPTRERFAALASAVPGELRIPRLVTAEEPLASTRSQVAPSGPERSSKRSIKRSTGGSSRARCGLVRGPVLTAATSPSW